MSEPIHISSLLLRAEPEKLGDVLKTINSVPNAEVPLSDESGKIIVTLETPSESAIIDALNQLQLIDGVVSASLVYHQLD
jgi:nitrate reductase NapD